MRAYLDVHPQRSSPGRFPPQSKGQTHLYDEPFRSEHQPRILGYSTLTCAPNPARLTPKTIAKHVRLSGITTGVRVMTILSRSDMHEYAITTAMDGCSTYTTGATRTHTDEKAWMLCIVCARWPTARTVVSVARGLSVASLHTLMNG